MRNLTVATAVLLACAASLALALGDQKTAPAEPPHDAQAVPATPGSPSTPEIPNPAKTESAPAAAKSATTTAHVLPSSPNRFAFNRVDGGFLRLDNQTGKIAFCSPQPIGWACQVVPEESAALEKEIARLQQEVASLRSEIAALREPPPPRPPADLTPAPPAAATPPPDKSEDSTKLREDLARARAAFESAWRRLVEIIVQLQKDMMRKS